MIWRDLIKAARVKVQLGWGQGRYLVRRPDAPPAYCILGALTAAQRDIRCRQQSQEAAVRRIAAAISRRAPGAFSGDGGSYWLVMRFNDAWCMDQETVLRVLDEAAEGK